MDTNLTPKISTLRLGIADRALGQLLSADVPADADQAQRDLIGDTYHSLYQQHNFREDVAPERATNKSLINWAQSSPSWQGLLEETRNSIPASITASELMFGTMTSDKAMQEALKKQKEVEEAEKAAEEAELNAEIEADMNLPTVEEAQKVANERRALANAKADEAKDLNQKIEHNAFNKGIMSNAIKAATKEAKKVNAVFGGWGHGPGSPIMRNPAQAIKFMQSLNPKVNRIAELAGRMRDIGSNARRQRVQIGQSPAGLHLTQDIDLILESELVLMTTAVDPVLRALQLKAYVDQGLLGWRLDGVLDKAGPFVFGADVSGSMNGPREESAKGVGLGLAHIAKAGGRPYHLFSFSSDEDEFISCSSEDDWQAHLDWAAMTINGGTSFDIALQKIMKTLKTMGAKGLSADAVLSSDGEAAVSTAVAEEWTKFAKETGARLLYIPVAKGYGSLEKLADHVIKADDVLDGDTMKQASVWMR